MDVGGETSQSFSGALATMDAAMTWEAWISLFDKQGFQMVLDWRDGEDKLCTRLFVQNGTDLRANLRMANGAYHRLPDTPNGEAPFPVLKPGVLDGDGNIRPGPWHHVALSYDGGTGMARLYCDGQEVGSLSTGGGNLTVGRELTFGSRGAGVERLDDPFQGFRGYIAEVRLWNRARTQEEIQQGMNHVLYMGHESREITHEEFLQRMSHGHYLGEDPVGYYLFENYIDGLHGSAGRPNQCLDFSAFGPAYGNRGTFHNAHIYGVPHFSNVVPPPPPLQHTRVYHHTLGGSYLTPGLSCCDKVGEVTRRAPTPLSYLGAGNTGVRIVGTKR